MLFDLYILTRPVLVPHFFLVLCAQLLNLIVKTADFNHRFIKFIQLNIVEGHKNVCVNVFKVFARVILYSIVSYAARD